MGRIAILGPFEYEYRFTEYRFTEYRARIANSQGL